MSALLFRIGAYSLISSLGWFTMTAAGLPRTPEPVAPIVVSSPVQVPEAPILDPSERLRQLELDPFYTPLHPATPVQERARTRLVWARVTACSPNDPQDLEYYGKNGYAGALHNIAADYRVFPRGTKIHVPGYLEQSSPGRFWLVDSPGGSVIRRSTAHGTPHIDVKFSTYYSARQWGSRWLQLEIEDP